MRYKKTILVRLNDRGILKEDPNYRKQVYLTQRDGRNCVLVKIVDSDYQVIFDRNVKALVICDKYGINAPRLIDFDPVKLELLITNVGENIFDVEKNKLKNTSWLRDGLKELEKINNAERSLRKLQRLPYFDKLERITNQSFLESEICKYYKSVVERVGVVYLGYGVDDPSPTNFCVRNGVVSIIDFDNFFHDTNIWISYGFAISNFYTRAGRVDVVLSDAVKLLYKFGVCGAMTNVENQLFRIGLLNNLATLHYDDFICNTFTSRQWKKFELSIIDEESSYRLS